MVDPYGVGMGQEVAMGSLWGPSGVPMGFLCPPGTLGVRLALLPLLLHAQREAARIAPHLPHIQRLAKELQEARRGAEPHRGGRGLKEMGGV